MIRLVHTRRTFSPTSTIGEITLDGDHQCWILEDVVRAPGVKVHGATAIPEGIYQLAITPSIRFKRDLPLLWNDQDKNGAIVTDHHGAIWRGIRIHPGNTAADTDGCLLTGTTWTKDKVHDSVKAFDPFFKILQFLTKDGPISFEIRSIKSDGAA
jgi:hypothetical protein